MQETFGNRITKLISEKNLTKVYVAQYIGVSKSMLTKYTKDEHEPTKARIAKLAELFGVSTDYLIYGKEHTPPELQTIKDIVDKAGKGNSNYTDDEKEIIKSMNEAKKVAPGTLKALLQILVDVSLRKLDEDRLSEMIKQIPDINLKRLMVKLLEDD